MYNLTVDAAHTYFVGSGQWLVHNVGGCPPTFRSQQMLTDHFAKHESEFGYNTEAEYLQGAQDLVTSTGPEQGTLIKTGKYGDTVYYKPSTDEFGMVSPDGYIRTYFKPDPLRHQYKTNMAYFIAQ